MHLKLVCWSVLFSLFTLSFGFGDAVTDRIEKNKAHAVKEVLQEIKNTIQAAQADIRSGLPVYDSKSWNTYILASKNVRSDSIELPEKSLIYVGEAATSVSLNINGDAILFFAGDLNGASIRVNGKAAIFYKNAVSRYYGSKISIRSGLIRSKKNNHCDIEIEQGGFFMCGGEQKGNVSGSGLIDVSIQKGMEGDIDFGHGGEGSSGVRIGKDLHGSIHSKQPLNVVIKRDYEGDIKSNANLGFQARHWKKGSASIDKKAIIQVQSISEQKDFERRIDMGQGSLRVKGNAYSSVHSKGNIIMDIGKNYTGRFIGNGEVDIKVKERLRGDVDASGTLKMNVDEIYGSIATSIRLILKANLVYAPNLSTREHARIKVGVIKANLNIGGTLSLVADQCLAGDFGGQAKAKAGNVQIKSDSYSSFTFIQDGRVDIFGHSYQNIEVGAKGLVKIGLNNYGEIRVGGECHGISIAGDSKGPIYVGGDSKEIGLQRLFASVRVKGELKALMCHETILTDSSPHVIQVGSGTIKIGGNNRFDIQSENAQKELVLVVEGDHLANTRARGQARLKIKGKNRGEIRVGRSGSLDCLTSRGNIEFGQEADLQVQETIEGHVVIGKNNKLSKIRTKNVLDGNISVQGKCKIHVDQIEQKGSDVLAIRIAGGELIASGDVNADFYSNGDAVLSASNILGDIRIRKSSK